MNRIDRQQHRVTRSLRGRALLRAVPLAMLMSLAVSAPTNAQTGSIPLPSHKRPAGIACDTAMVPMRDGVRLYTEVYKPEDAARLPVVVVRNPYGRGLGHGCFNSVISDLYTHFAQDGYAVILQEVRGTMASEGTFQSFFQEQHDGYDTIEWAAVQPWSNGKVAMTGASYMGATQWQSAITVPPHLVAIAPYVTSMDYRDDWVARNGVYDHQFAHTWAMGFVADQLSRRLEAEGAPATRIEQAVASWRNQAKTAGNWTSDLPLDGKWGDTAVGGTRWTIRELIPFKWDWYRHPDYDSYWRLIDPLPRIKTVTVPAQISGAWYDLFANGTIASYRSMRTAAGSKAAREGTTLAMDCCGHALQTQSLPRQINWGPNRIDAMKTRRFLDFHLKNTDNGYGRSPRVELTVMVPPDQGSQGDNFILFADDYPVPGTVTERWYLGGGGHANSRHGDGVLTLSPPGKSPPDTFVYDPVDPVPTAGGVDAEAPAVDQSTVELRDDVLVYTSTPFTESKLLIGPVNVRFWASSSARDTDFVAKLVDVHPDGYAHNIVDRVVRARYRKGAHHQAALLKPGKVYPFQIHLGDTATEMRPGHRLRIELSSSNFPHYARNLNTGQSNESTDAMVRATQTIFHDARHPSSVDLSILPLPANCLAEAHRDKSTRCAIKPRGRASAR
jgi:uncharacterized protein